MTFRLARVVQKTDYKGWSITVIEKRFNMAKPYIVAIKHQNGHSRTMFGIENGEMMMVIKEITYASLSTAREAGETAINYYMKPK